MKDFFQYFKIFIITAASLCTIAVLMFIISKAFSTGTYVRTNTETLTEERVFDYADVLTQEEEDKLTALILEKQDEVGCDIIIVTLNESLKDYAEEDRGFYVPTDEYTMIYADNFYDENLFGYDQSHGDGGIYVDNWYREADGYRYTWFSTSGKVEDAYSDEMIQTLLDETWVYTEADPYKAYATFVNNFTEDMKIAENPAYGISNWSILLAAFVVALIFFASHVIGASGKKTTIATTYLTGGTAKMNRKEDIFLNKTVHSRVIQNNNGSGHGGGGGGGHHMSSGGFSHGGGGGRH